jgi:hypothetical protein
MDPEYLSLALRRAARKDLEPKLEKLKYDLHSVLGQDVNITYNLRELHNILTSPENIQKIRNSPFAQEGVLDNAIPGAVANYIESAIKKLRALNFNMDDLYRKEWLAASPQGVLFEVVSKLKTVSLVDTLLTAHGIDKTKDAPHNECIYRDGYFRLRTLPEHFGDHYATIADRAMDQL